MFSMLIPCHKQVPSGTLLGSCYPPSLGVNKEMMSQGPQVEDTEF
jgi:hypothetical protein